LVRMQVDRVVTPIWYVIGVTGNTLSAVVWLQRRMRANNSSAVYLVALSISDLLFLLLHFVQVGRCRSDIHSTTSHDPADSLLPVSALAAIATVLITAPNIQSYYLEERRMRCVNWQWRLQDLVRGVRESYN